MNKPSSEMTERDWELWWKSVVRQETREEMEQKKGWRA